MQVELCGFFLFSELAVILFWQIELCFTLLSFFTLSKEFLVHIFFFLPLPLAVCMDQCIQAVTPSPLHCWFAASCAAEAWAEPSPWEAQVKPWLSLWAASSAMGRTCRRGGRTRWASKGENALSFLYFSLVLCCISSDQPQGACVWLDHLCCSGTTVQRIALPSMLQGMWDGCCSQL